MALNHHRPGGIGWCRVVEVLGRSEVRAVDSSEVRAQPTRPADVRAAVAQVVVLQEPRIFAPRELSRERAQYSDYISDYGIHNLQSVTPRGFSCSSGVPLVVLDPRCCTDVEHNNENRREKKTDCGIILPQRNN